GFCTMPTSATSTPRPVSASTKRRLPADDSSRTRPASQMTRAAYNTSATRVLAGQIDKACALPAANAGSSSLKTPAARGLRAFSSDAGNGTSWTAIAAPTATSAHTNEPLNVVPPAALEGAAAAERVTAMLHAADATAAAASDQ